MRIVQALSNRDGSEEAEKVGLNLKRDGKMGGDDIAREGETGKCPCPGSSISLDKQRAIQGVMYAMRPAERPRVDFER